MHQSLITGAGMSSAHQCIYSSERALKMGITIIPILWIWRAKMAQLVKQWRLALKQGILVSEFMLLGAMCHCFDKKKIVESFINLKTPTLVTHLAAQLYIPEAIQNFRPISQRFQRCATGPAYFLPLPPKLFPLLSP